MPEAASSTLVTMTDRAAQKAQALLSKSGPDAALRIRVISGGCAGLEYRMEPAQGEAEAGDHVVIVKGIRLFLDPKGLLYLAGSEIDYQSSLMSSKFVFKNPNAVMECSCGDSFTV